MTSDSLLAAILRGGLSHARCATLDQHVRRRVSPFASVDGHESATSVAAGRPSGVLRAAEAPRSRSPPTPRAPRRPKAQREHVAGPYSLRIGPRSRTVKVCATKSTYRSRRQRRTLLHRSRGALRKGDVIEQMRSPTPCGRSCPVPTRLTLFSKPTRTGRHKPGTKKRTRSARLWGLVRRSARRPDARLGDRDVRRRRVEIEEFARGE